MYSKLLGIILLLSIDLTFSTTYYVDSKEGNDDNPGTSKSVAWNSISKVNSFGFSPGDIISFKTGLRYLVTTPITNKSNVTFNSYGTGTRPVIDAKGTCIPFDFGTAISANYVTFNGLKIVNGNPCNVNMYGCNYITFESCNIDSSAGSGGTLDNPNNIYSGGVSSYLTIRNCTMNYSSYGNGIYISGTSHSLLEHDTVIYNNHSGFRVAWGDSNTYDLTIRYCVSRFNGGYAHENDGMKNSYVYYNLFESSSYGVIYLWQEGGTETAPTNCNYYNNTFIVSGSSMFAQIESFSKMSNVVFKNNIIYLQGTPSCLGCDFIGGSPNSSEFIFENNLYYKTNGTPNHLWLVNGSYLSGISAWQSLGGYGYDTPGGQYANPLFTNAASGDFSLQIGSPAINTGTNVGLKADLNGNSVPSNYPDLGAFQHPTVH